MLEIGLSLAITAVPEGMCLVLQAAGTSSGCGLFTSIAKGATHCAAVDLRMGCDCNLLTSARFRRRTSQVCSKGRLGAAICSSINCRAEQLGTTFA